MVAFLALVAGYVMGAKVGSRDLDQVASVAEADGGVRGVRRRRHRGSMLTSVTRCASSGHCVDGESEPSEETGDLVERVRHLFAREG